MCQSNPKKEYSTWPQSSEPFERIHLDFCWPIKGKNFLVLIDIYSKWLEVFVMDNITSEITISKLKKVFARFGIPKTIVTDNGPSLVSQEFEAFCKLNGIRHVTSPAYHPSSNGQAENSVKTLKHAL